MKYSQGKIERVFLVRIEDGENPLDAIKELAHKEEIKIATVLLLGALKSAEMVVGPKEPVSPPVPVWEKFSDAREVLGIGTIVRNELDEASIHLHAVTGRQEKTTLGCIRSQSSTYLIVEAVILELIGIQATRIMDYDLGINKLKI